MSEKNPNTKITTFSQQLLIKAIVFSEVSSRSLYAYRPSVCLSSVCNVGAPYSAG